MSEGKSPLQSFGGAKGLALLIAGFVAVTAYQAWQRSSSSSALAEVAAELGLEVHQQGRRPQLRGRIGDIGVAVDVTAGTRTGQTGSMPYFTRFRLYDTSAPYGRIVGANLRQRVIEGFSDDERLATGDPAFDEAVIVIGEPDMLAHLDTEARAAVRLATQAGWSLDAYTWEALEPGEMNDTQAIRDLLEVGLSAARAARLDGD